MTGHLCISKSNVLGLRCNDHHPRGPLSEARPGVVANMRWGPGIVPDGCSPHIVSTKIHAQRPLERPRRAATPLKSVQNVDATGWSVITGVKTPCHAVYRLPPDPRGCPPGSCSKTAERPRGKLVASVWTLPCLLLPVSSSAANAQHPLVLHVIPRCPEPEDRPQNRPWVGLSRNRFLWMQERASYESLRDGWTDM